ncbi:MAG: hypothetical protein VXW65_01630 [Pseudomonadota bacterium]|nr:hypothetical protein [Pseudomonadota bacterium]
MDELAAIIIAVFIANYQAEKHPYLTCFVKAFLIAVLFFLFVTVQDLMGNEFSPERAIFSLKLTIGLWLFLWLWLALLEFIFPSPRRRD